MFLPGFIGGQFMAREFTGQATLTPEMRS